MLFAFFQRLIRDKSGVGFVELALAAPLLALLFLGMVDLSNVVSTRIDLEQAAQRTTDFALAKRPTSASTTYLVSEANSASGVPTSDIRVQLILECDGTVQSDFGDTCLIGETMNRFVKVEIDKQVNTGFNWQGMASLFVGGSGTYQPVTVTGDSIVRIQ